MGNMRRLIVLCAIIGSVLSDKLSSSYGPPAQTEQTDVEVQQVEVYEVPWIGDQPASGPPNPVYGPPPQDSATTDYPDSATVNSVANKPEKLQEFMGEYYVYHPTGLLQKVHYKTRDDGDKMAFSAQLKYENVSPIRGPIYTYDPRTYVFSRINRK